VTRILGAALVVAVPSGCAWSSPPAVASPTKGQSAEQQARDSGECRTWAKQPTGYDPALDTARGAGIGAVGGAATGAAIGAASGSGAGTGAAVGAVVGGVGGAAAGGGSQYTKTKAGYDKAYGACMSGRGYSVR
jgi:hypothetical protein